MTPMTPMTPARDRRPTPTAIEDYVKVVYAHTEWQPTPITSGGIAARLGLAPSTATEMVKRLVAEGLLLHERYGAVTLTAPGRELALRMVRRHRLIETWLVRQFDYRWDEVHDVAEELEHALPDRMLDAIDDQLGRPAADPHGDPIPTREGRVTVPDAVLLADADGGIRGTIVRISDRDPAVLRLLDAAGIGVGTAVGRDDVPPTARDAIWIAG
ncbi:metal-dependent transcriptional regulator [Galbitalea sp. SE-J8]|uniref:metal-dependent transcriptional regulator n=1 Tax=Galbitalea sp. SE-J8 TaxID=3054952 RepID=UPI00259CB59E|nr:metal-dependent transcriptional regulator [Galbitalea sp. SE-J8]MDM4763558.1 metal-dependent transcriptional regulator [Galbitalea sp. SE-J8]